MSRPVIGVSCYVEEVDRGSWRRQPSAVLPWDYVAHVQRAGGHAVILPPRVDATDELAREVIERVDGLVIAGGADIDPSRYGCPPHPLAQDPRPDRDAWELALARVSAELDTPLLGICRGMQVMAVAAGGAIEQHLPDIVGHADHSPTPGLYTTHPVRCLPGTRVAEILGLDELVVPTYHHQAVVESSLAGTRYRPAARHPDGTLEAMEDTSGRFRTAVQWHPETGSDPRLFDALIAAASRDVH